MAVTVVVLLGCRSRVTVVFKREMDFLCHANDESNDESNGRVRYSCS